MPSRVSAWSVYDVFALAGAITYWLGYRYFTAGSMSLGTVYVIFFYTDALLRPVIQITRQIEDLVRNGAPGVHFYTLNRALSTTRILTNLGHGPKA